MNAEQKGEIVSPLNQSKRVGFLRLAAVTAAAATCVLVLAGCGHRPRVSITVAGKHEQVPAVTTLAQAVSLYQLHPPAGNILDVQGNVLRREVFLGSVLFDGRRAPSSTRARSGDRVATVRGPDRTDPRQGQLVSGTGERAH